MVINIVEQARKAAGLPEFIRDVPNFTKTDKKRSVISNDEFARFVGHLRVRIEDLLGRMSEDQRICNDRHTKDVEQIADLKVKLSDAERRLERETIHADVVEILSETAEYMAMDSTVKGQLLENFSQRFSWGGGHQKSLSASSRQSPVK